MKIKTQERHRSLLPLLFVGAALTALTLILPKYLGAIEWISMIPIFLAVYRLDEREEIRGGRAYAYGFFTVYVYYVFLWHWIARMYPLSFLDISPAVSLFIIAAACLGNYFYLLKGEKNKVI